MEKGRRLMSMQPLFPKDVVRFIPRWRGPWGGQGLLLQLTAVVTAWALIGFPVAQGQHSKPTEYEVKATYLYNFARFIEWPARAIPGQGGSFTICVLGQDPFGLALNASVADEAIGGQNVVARRISTALDAVNCRVLFISSSEDPRLKQILAALDNSSVLTVSDMPQFVRRGGMVQFILEGNRVRFAVSLAPTEHAGLTLSSELLKLAVSVRNHARPGD
jgi:hypothetical protein